MIVKLYLTKKGNSLTGYINKNSKGEYFPSMLSMGIFNNMMEVDEALLNLKLRPNMELNGFEVIDETELTELTHGSLTHAIKKEVTNLLDRYEIYSVVYVSIKCGEVNISFDNFTARFKQTKIFHITQPYHGKYGSTHLNGNYTEEFVEDFIKLVFELIY